MDPKEIAREIKEVDIKEYEMINEEVTKTYNPNARITRMVRKYADYVGDEETAKNFSAGGDFPEIHKMRAIDRVAHMAEFEGYDFLEIVHS